MWWRTPRPDDPWSHVCRSDIGTGTDGRDLKVCGLPTEGLRKWYLWCVVRAGVWAQRTGSGRGSERYDRG